MCPACLATAAWVAVGTTSAGGVVLFMVKEFLRRRAVLDLTGAQRRCIVQVASTCGKVGRSP